MHSARSVLIRVSAALIVIATASALAHAEPCAGTGMVVVTDPAGDVQSDQHDIVSIEMAEIFGGRHAGRFGVALNLSATEPPGPEVAGIWITRWEQFGGDTTMTLTVRRCHGEFTGNYTRESADGQYSEQGPFDELSVTAGRIQIVLSRSKLGNPPPGALQDSIVAVVLALEPLAPPLDCLPRLGETETAGPGSYTMGACVTSSPLVAAPSHIALGPAVPNPARQGVRLTLHLPSAVAEGLVEASVFDANGRRIRALAGVETGPGARPIEWDLREDSGRRVSPGSYWVRVRAGEISLSRRVAVLR